MRSLVGWLETRLAQITINDLQIAQALLFAQFNVRYVEVS